MKKLHFLFTNGAKFSLEIPDGTNIRERVGLLSKFVTANNLHVDAHKSCYASSSPVKFPTSRGFFVGYETENGTLHTIVTPTSKAIKYRGKALMLDTLAGEIEYRVNNITNQAPFTGCTIGYTPAMCDVLEAEFEARERKALKQG